ncbi:hypothetical protein PALU110988_16915 [Paenibacillus lupini]|uniref:hypothetical protein n=1 Tax=Paenibacillus lupini TaxID=1450204 RepID=UPI00141EB5B6|nr:hypothetical protein [Paenibacillus lupini]NIK24539.1 hypothetical protein [Paenibacillus lupini]
MQALWKKSASHLALPALVIALLLIGFQFMKVDADRNKGTFYLKDHQGDRSALADVTISGELGDGFHKSSFYLEKGNVVTRTQVYDPPREVWYNNLSLDKLKGNLRYDLIYQPSSITVRDPKDSNSYWTASVMPNITEYNDTGQPKRDNTSAYTNRLEYGLAKIGDQDFFVVPSTNHYVGISGIYKLNFIDARSNPGETPPSEALVTFSLDKNKEPSPSEIQVLGLEAVGDKLALILEEDQRLVIRSYDSKSGKLLGEVAADDFTVSNAYLAESKRKFNESYEAYSDVQNNRLSIAFMSGYEQGLVQKIIWSFDLSDGVKLLDETEITYKDLRVNDKRNMESIHYLNGKLYVIYSNLELGGKTDYDQFVFDPYQPKKLIIQVYETHKLLYEGELVTDHNDDLISLQNYKRDSFTYDPVYNREFEHIVVQSIK